MKEEICGNCENIEHLNAKFQEILGRNANKTDDYLEEYHKKGYYFLKGFDDNQIFKCSHVKKIKNL